MKKSIVIFCFLFNSCTNGQSIRFQLLRNDFCSRNFNIDSTGYSLIDKLNDTTYNALHQSKNGIISLPRFGTYFINTYYTDSLFTNIKIEIKDTGLFVYYFNEPKLAGAVDPNIYHPFLQYFSCGHLANGYLEDFFNNGNPRIKGNFINGQPLDSVIIFYPSGFPKTKKIILKKQIIIEKYDSLFNLVELSKYKRGYLADYKETLFFTNKNIKSIEERKKGIFTLKEYFERGNIKTIQTKTKRIEYYSDGKISCSYRWKKVKDLTINDYNFVITRDTFDINEKMVQRQVYEYWINNPKISTPKLNIDESDWIVFWIKIKDGITTTICEDESTEDYFKEVNKNSH